MNIRGIPIDSYSLQPALHAVFLPFGRRKMGRLHCCFFASIIAVFISDKIIAHSRTVFTGNFVASMFVGIISVVSFQIKLVDNLDNIIVGAALALVVGILSEIFAIVKKAPATGFIVIGVIPLVPGFRVYRSMLYFVRGALDKGLTEGVRACFMAIAIAVGIILATSITRIVRQHIKH